MLVGQPVLDTFTYTTIKQCAYTKNPVKEKHRERLNRKLGRGRKTWYKGDQMKAAKYKIKRPLKKNKST